jgi:hypothetical protein
MADGMGLLRRFRGLAQRDAVPAATVCVVPQRTARHVLDGCEYEIRQMRREVLESRRARLTKPAAPLRCEPFVPGGRLRDAEFRARLATAGMVPPDAEAGSGEDHGGGSTR